MDNKHNTPWEEEALLSETPEFFPEEPDEEVPLIQELAFGSEETAEIEDLSAEQAPETEPPIGEPAEAADDQEAAPVEEEMTLEMLPLPEPELIPLQMETAPEVTGDFGEEPSEAAVCPEEEAPCLFMDVPAAAAAEEAPEQLPAAEAVTAGEVAAPQSAETDAPGTQPDPVEEILSDPTLLPAAEPAPVSEEIADQEYRDITPPQPEPAGKKKKAADPRPTLKGRPKRKKGEGFFGIPNILATFVWLALILAIGVTLGRMLWVCAADVLAFGRADQRVTITVYESDTMEDIIDKLYQGGLIRYKGLFSLYADISDAEEDIKPGIYDLNTRYDYHALVNFMSPSSSREVVELTIPEGYTCRQIFALLEENRVCTAVDIAAYAASGELSDYWFLEGLERGSEYCLEGYLFPDTYQFYKNSTPREALEKMLDNFDHRFTEEMRLQIDSLNANVTDGTYGIREVVIVASLIEKESAAPAESPTIASVIYNRLFNWDYPALLNIDAAIVYAQGGEAEHIDTSIDSPYNTYRYAGLTPTAISNPGLASLKAALNPENTDYYYYVLNPSTGMHQFSKTQEEHDAWIDKFYN